MVPEKFLLQDPAYKGTPEVLKEKLATHTLSIFIGKTGEIATGVAIFYQKKYFIVTAGHVLDSVSVEDIFLAERPTTSGQDAQSKEDLRYKSNFEVCSPFFQLNGIQTFNFQENGLDIGIITLPDGQVLKLEKTHFFEIEKQKTLKVKGDFVIPGFSRELATRQRVNRNTIQINVHLLFEYPKRINNKGDITDFDSKYHLLFCSPAAELLQDPEITDFHGMSGAGVWLPVFLNKPIWLFHPQLVGIQTGVYSSRRFKATKLKYVIEKMDECLL